MSGSYLYAVKPNYGNKPVSYIDFFDALRFANWLHNGQPTGPQNASTTEDGAYTLEGGTPVPTNHMAVVRNPDAEWFVPSLDEWYKAANYDPRTEIEGGPPSDDFYWRFATQSDMDPTEATANSVGDVTNPGANVANYNLGASWNGGSPYVTTVGGAGPLSASFYGTYGQAGNIEEWTDDPGGGAIQIYRIKIGGSWNAGPADQLTLAEAIHVSAANNLPSGGSNDAGFRVAKVVPEPGSLGLGMFAVGLLSLFGWMKRGKRKGTAGATGINLRGPCGWGQGEWLGSSAASLQVGVYK